MQLKDFHQAAIAGLVADAAVAAIVLVCLPRRRQHSSQASPAYAMAVGHNVAVGSCCWARFRAVGGAWGSAKRRYLAAGAPVQLLLALRFAMGICFHGDMLSSLTTAILLCVVVQCSCAHS